MNPRLSIGHGLHSRAADMPLGAMERMQTEGDLEIDAAALEETLLTAATNSRRGGLLLPLTGEHAPDKAGVRFVDGRAVAVDPEDECDATMEIGGAVMGSIIIVRLDPARTPTGPSIAPLAAAIFTLAATSGTSTSPRWQRPRTCAPGRSSLATGDSATEDPAGPRSRRLVRLLLQRFRRGGRRRRRVRR